MRKLKKNDNNWRKTHPVSNLAEKKIACSESLKVYTIQHIHWQHWSHLKIVASHKIIQQLQHIHISIMKSEHCQTVNKHKSLHKKPTFCWIRHQTRQHSGHVMPYKKYMSYPAPLWKKVICCIALAEKGSILQIGIFQLQRKLM